MDDLDQHLLDRLRLNARAPVAELARSLGLSRTTIQSRLARLERTGVIAGYAVRLARSEAGPLIRAHLMLTVAPRAAADVSAALQRRPAVLRLHTVSGPFDMLAEVEVPDAAELDTFLGEVAALPGVEAARAAVVLATKFER